MEKEIVQGSAGGIKFTFSNGKARIEGQAAVGDAGFSAGGFVEEDSSVLLDKLFAAIEAKLPPGAVPIEETVKVAIKELVAKI